MADPTIAPASSSKESECDDASNATSSPRDESSSNATSSPKESLISSDTRESSSSPPSNGDVTLKPSTSSWKRGDLLALKISVSSHCDAKKSPSDIVNLIDINYVGVKSLLFDKKKLKTVNREVEARIQSIASEIRTSFAHQLMIKPLDEMDVSDVLFEHDDIWKIRSKNLEDEDYFSATFQVYGRAFFRHMRYCLYLRDEQNKDLTEYLYQHLFVSFLQIFGVKCQFAPLLPSTSMRILGQKVSGVPDIVGKFNVKENGKYKQKSLFVCEVKKQYVREEEPSPKKMRFSSPSKSGPVMPDALLGQHGGELLLYYPSSVAENAVIGLIVEQTHVTFTALLLAEEDFTKLKDGSLKLRKNIGPKLIFTRPYNFMVKEDRDHLIEPLLKLGFIQDIGSIY